ncbi:uncharacterized protein EAE98_009670 [Botrytis deweyae]|uniref:Helicase ATP-binding domain-containing protein n=1 Tax=Botrytis deweyae TaxID=2478750 RepID=A0ABQ7IBK8_9HELO|nr:uncharacterized protein EAE98_009670 [Botrytis deweyae]KAF7918892.1 hypothetical protein EAE98_009670 [Botrytis deweyae]
MARWFAFITPSDGNLPDFEAFQKTELHFRVDRNILFQAIEDLKNPTIMDLITGTDIMIKKSDIPAPQCQQKNIERYYRWLHVMNLIILNYPEHFEGDPEPHTADYEIHTAENSNRALAVLRAFNKKDVSKVKSQLGVKPLFHTPRISKVMPYHTTKSSDDSLACVRSQFHHQKQSAYRTRKIVDCPDGDDFDDEESVKTILSFAKEWNGNGILTDVQRDATSRPLVSEKNLEIFFEEVQNELEPLIEPSFDEIIDAAQKIQAEWVATNIYPEQTFQNEYTKILDRMSAASAITPPFLDCSVCLGYEDYGKLQIENSTLIPFSHQIMDVTWMIRMEESPYHGGILAGDPGIGKTITMLLLIYFQWKINKNKQGFQHLPTLILAPSALTGVWFDDFVKFFKNILVCKLFLPDTQIYGADRDEASIGKTAKDLDDYLGSLDTSDPDTLKIFIISSYTCFPERVFRNDGGDGRILLRNKDKFARFIGDEFHALENFGTVISKCVSGFKFKSILGATRTPILNKVDDIYGYLFLFARCRAFFSTQNLPKKDDMSSLFQIYDGHDESYLNYLIDQSPENIKRFKDANALGYPLQMLCPQAFRLVGWRTKWNIEACRMVLPPILIEIQLRRFMGKRIELSEGEFVTPGGSVPPYKMLTVHLKMPQDVSDKYKRMTRNWKDQIGDGDALDDEIEDDVQSHNMNIQANRGLMHASFDPSLTSLTVTVREGLKSGGSKEVNSWRSLDKDHGATFKFLKSRSASEQKYPPYSERLQMSTTLMEGERAVIFFHWPMPQWACETLLKLLQFEILSLCAWHTTAEREEIIRKFNDVNYECDALLITFPIGAQGFNIQDRARYMIMGEYAHSMEVFIKAGGRIIRIGARRAALILILHTVGTHGDALRLNLLKKLASRIIAESDFDTNDERAIRREAMRMARMLLGVSGVVVPKELENFEEMYQKSFGDSGPHLPDHYNVQGLNSADGVESDEDDAEENDSEDEEDDSIKSERSDSMELEHYDMANQFGVRH